MALLRNDDHAVPYHKRHWPFYSWSHIEAPHFPVTPLLFDQHFGSGLNPEDIFEPRPNRYEDAVQHGRIPLASPRHCQHHQHHNEHSLYKTGVSEVLVEADKYQVTLDVQDFKPEEIDVKTTTDSLIIEGDHEEKEDEHGFVYRTFRRRYILPNGVKPDDLQCHISLDGLLTVKAPRALPALEEKPIEVVPNATNRLAQLTLHDKEAEANHFRRRCCRSYAEKERCCDL